MPFRKKKKKVEEREGKKTLLETLEERFAAPAEEVKHVVIEKEPIKVLVRESATISQAKTDARGVLKVSNETSSPILSVEIKLSGAKSTSLGKDRIFIPFLQKAGDPGSEKSFEYSIQGKVGLPVSIESGILVEGAREDKPIFIKGEEARVRLTTVITNESDVEIPNVKIRRILPKQFRVFNAKGFSEYEIREGEVVGSTGMLLPGKLVELVLEADVSVTDSNPISLGSLEISAEFNRTISGLEVTSVSGSAKVSPSIKTSKRQDSPDVWEATLEIENPNDFPVTITGKVTVKSGEVIQEEAQAYGLRVEGNSLIIEDLVIAERDRRSLGPFSVRSKDVPKFSVGIKANVRGLVEYVSEVKASQTYGTVPVLWAELEKSAKAIHSGIYKDLLKQDEVPSSGRTKVAIELKAANKGSAEIGYIRLEERVPPGFEPPNKVDVKKKGQTLSASVKVEPEGADLGVDRTMVIELSSGTLSGTLKPGETVTVTYELLAVSPLAEESFPLITVAKVSTDAENKILEISIPDERAPVIHVKRIVEQIELSKDINFIGPDTFEVVIKVRNESNIPILNYTVTERVPPSFQVISVSQGGQKSQTQKGTVITWKLQRLEPDEEVVLTYQVKGKGEYRVEDLLKLE